jgi:hypothetical protein
MRWSVVSDNHVLSVEINVVEINGFLKPASHVL